MVRSGTSRSTSAGRRKCRRTRGQRGAQAQPATTAARGSCHQSPGLPRADCRRRTPPRRRSRRPSPRRAAPRPRPPPRSRPGSLRLPADAGAAGPTRVRGLTHRSPATRARHGPVGRRQGQTGAPAGQLRHHALARALRTGRGPRRRAARDGSARFPPRAVPAAEAPLPPGALPAVSPALPPTFDVPSDGGRPQSREQSPRARGCRESASPPAPAGLTAALRSAGPPAEAFGRPSARPPGCPAAGSEATERRPDPTTIAVRGGNPGSRTDRGRQFPGACLRVGRTT